MIKGEGNASAVGTLVERSSRLLMLVRLSHLKPATAAHVLQAFSDKLASIAQPMRQSMNYDRGREMAMHAKLTERTDVAVHFCDPYCPWQRGSNENTNGLVHQYLPKGTNLSGYSQEQLDAIAYEINGRPQGNGRTIVTCRLPTTAPQQFDSLNPASLIEFLGVALQV